MKVLMISTDRKIFEDGSDVRQRIVEYGQLADELHIIIFNQGEKFENQNFGNVFIYSTNSLSRWFYICNAVKIGKDIIQKSEEWIITTQDPFETGLAGYRISKKTKTKLQFQIHTDFLSPFFKKDSFLNRIRLEIAKKIIPKADCIRVVSKRIKDSLVDKLKIDESKISVLPIYTDINAIKNASIQTDLHQKYSQFNFIILMASRLTKEKNIEMAIEVMKEIVKENPKVGLVALGEGPEKKKLQKLAKRNSNIIFEGWSGDLPSYYKTADMFLLTSNYEGYGRTIIEAVASNCFVVMTDVGIAGDIVKSEYNGIVIPVGGKKELIEEIQKSLKDGVHINNMVVSAERTINSFSSMEEYLQETKKSWEMCLN